MNSRTSPSLRNAVLVAVALTTTAVLSARAAPVTVFRCGAEGNVYSQLPCAGGTAFDASDARTAAQRADALRSADAERRRAAQLQADRLRQAARLPASTAGSLGPAHVATPAVTVVRGKTLARRSRSAARRLRSDDDRDFIAYSPATKAKRP